MRITTRRQFLKRAGVAGTMAMLVGISAAAQDVIKPTVLQNDSLFWVRGFNYQPSYATHGLRIWAEFKKDIVEREIMRGKELYPDMTAIRIWLSLDAYVAEPRKMPENVSTTVAIAGKAGVKVMPVLFNNWHSIPDFGGVSEEMLRYWTDRPGSPFYSYLDALLDRHDRDERVLGWDLCNEPFNNGNPDTTSHWLERVQGHIKSRDPDLNVTIGVAPGLDQLARVEPLCDFLTPHIYSASPDPYVEFANSKGKPMFVSETGWGDPNEDVRLQILCQSLSALVERRVGFTIHALSHSLVADLHRKEYGPVSEVDFMGCIESDGSLRKGYEAIYPYFR